MRLLSSIMASILTFFHETLGVGWGMAIIFLTILVKVVLFPFSLSQIRSMEGMKKIQPELKKIQEKYKSNPEEQQRKMMELYQKNKVNPVGGCLPLLLQLPVLLALFSVLRTPQNYNLDFTNAYFLTMDLTKSHSYWLLAVISGATSFLQQKMTMVSADSSQSAFMYFMPIFMGYITYTLTAGVGLYWVASTVLGIIQQWVITQFFLQDQSDSVVKNEKE
jgi:YidC/Oxa1 family membrane protein insertase